MRSFVVLAVASSLAVLSTVAGAAAPAEDPEALIRIGNELRRTGDDARAEGYFARAYQLAHTPRSAAQLGLAELAVGKFLAAETHLSEALATDDTWIRAHASQLEHSRSSARAHLVGVEIVGAPTGATLELGEGKTAELGPDATVWLAPGAVSVKVVAAGHRAALVTLTGKAGEHPKVQVQMPALAEAEAPPPPRPPAPTDVPGATPAIATTVPPAPTPDAGPSSHGRSMRIVGITLALVGAAAGVAGAALLLTGRSKAKAYYSTAPYDPANDDYDTFQHAGVATLIGAGALVAGGVALYAAGARADAAEAGPSVSMAAGPHFGGVLWQGRF